MNTRRCEARQGLGPFEKVDTAHLKRSAFVAVSSAEVTVLWAGM